MLKLFRLIGLSLCFLWDMRRVCQLFYGRWALSVERYGNTVWAACSPLGPLTRKFLLPACSKPPCSGPRSTSNLSQSVPWLPSRFQAMCYFAWRWRINVYVLSASSLLRFSVAQESLLCSLVVASSVAFSESIDYELFVTFSLPACSGFGRDRRP